MSAITTSNLGAPGIDPRRRERAAASAESMADVLVGVPRWRTDGSSSVVRQMVRRVFMDHLRDRGASHYDPSSSSAWTDSLLMLMNAVSCDVCASWGRSGLCPEDNRHCISCGGFMLRPRGLLRVAQDFDIREGKVEVEVEVEGEGEVDA